MQDMRTKCLIAGVLACGLHGIGWAQKPAAPPSKNSASQGKVKMHLVDPLTGSVESTRLMSGVPLGGIGTGTFQLFTDGTIGQITLADPLAKPLPDAPACFASLWTRAEGKTTAQVLALTSPYRLPTVSELDYEGLFPQANLTFPAPQSPIQTALTAFSPLIPYDLQNSSFPAVAYVLRLKNLTQAPVEVSVALSWENILSPQGLERQKNGTKGIATIIPSSGGYFGARFTPTAPNRGKNDKKDDKSATMTLLGYPNRAQAVVTTALWDASAPRPPWWERFAHEGTVDSVTSNETDNPANSSTKDASKDRSSIDCQRPAAVVAMRVTLKPNELLELPFAVSWYVPSQWDTRAENSGRLHSEHFDREHFDREHFYREHFDREGHYYEVAFSSAEDAGKRLLADWRSLYGLTEEWQKRLMFSNLPHWAASRMINAAAPLATNTIHTRDGRFALYNTNFYNTRNTSSNAVLPATPAEAERHDTRSHEAAQALLLAFYPQLAAQELTQFAGLQDSMGLMPPPATANPFARLGPPIPQMGPMIPQPNRSLPAPAPTQNGKSTAPRRARIGKSEIGKSDKNKTSKVGDSVPPPASQPPVAVVPMPPTPITPPAEVALDPIDSTSDYLLGLTRFVLWTGDQEFLKQRYPSVQRAAHALIEQRRTHAPLPPDSLSHWIAAMRAAQRLASMMQDTMLTDTCANAAQAGSTQMDGTLWNGAFYTILSTNNLSTNNLSTNNPSTNNSSPTNQPAITPDMPVPATAVCASDQLWGQGIAYQLGLGPLLSLDHLQTAARSIQRINDQYMSRTALPATARYKPFSPFTWRARVDGLPVGKQGSEACLLPATVLGDISVALWQNQPEVALEQMLYLEEFRNDRLATPYQYPTLLPLNRMATLSSLILAPDQVVPAELLEVGTLAVASDWNLLYALEGFGWDSGRAELTLTPRIPGYWQSFQAPVFAPNFWGRIEYRPTAHGGTLTFRLDRLMGFVVTPARTSLTNRAELTIRTLRLPGPSLPTPSTPFTAHASHGRDPVGSRTVRNPDGTVTLTFDSPVVMTAGDRMQVDIH